MRLSSLREKIRESEMAVAANALEMEYQTTEEKEIRKAAKAERAAKEAKEAKAAKTAARTVRRAERVVVRSRVAVAARASTGIRSASCSLTCSSLFRTESFACKVMVLCAFWLLIKRKTTESKI